jgi:hypothetical protein
MDDTARPPAETPDARRRRKGLHVPLSAALAGLGLVSGPQDASAAIARPDFVAVPMNTIVTGIDVLANDTFANGYAMITSIGSTAGAGTLSIQGVPPSQTLSFKATAGFLGARIVPYCMGDLSGQPNACSFIYLSVQSPNIASYIVASDDHYTTTQGKALRKLQVLANDTFDPDALSVSTLLAAQAIGGTPGVSPKSLGNYGISGLNFPPAPPVNAQSYMLDYVPNPGFVGLDSFQYCVDSFGRPGTQTCATVYVNVLPSIVSAPAPVPAMGGYALMGLSGVLGWLALRLRRRA